MFLRFQRLRIWIPSIKALMGSERLSLVKKGNNLKVESKSKQYKKGMNISKNITSRHYSTRKK